MDNSGSDSDASGSSDTESGSSMDWDDFRTSSMDYARDDGGVLLRSAEDIRSNRSLCARRCAERLSISAVRNATSRAPLQLAKVRPACIRHEAA